MAFFQLAFTFSRVYIFDGPFLRTGTNGIYRNCVFRFWLDSAKKPREGLCVVAYSTGQFGSANCFDLSGQFGSANCFDLSPTDHCWFHWSDARERNYFYFHSFHWSEPRELLSAIRDCCSCGGSQCHW